MGKRQTQQVGGRKEAPLAVVGNTASEHKPDTPEDAEQKYYQELVNGFLAMLLRWNTLIESNGGEIDVIDDGGTLTTVPGDTPYNPQKKPVLMLRKSHEFAAPEIGIYHAEFEAHAGDAEPRRLVTPNGLRLGKVGFSIRSDDYSKMTFSDKYTHLRDTSMVQKLDIEAEYGGYKSDQREANITGIPHIKYLLINGIMRPHDPINPVHGNLEPDVYATYLFTLVDRLVTGSPTATPQPGRKLEQAIPTLPAPQRRGAGRP